MRRPTSRRRCCCPARCCTLATALAIELPPHDAAHTGRRWHPLVVDAAHRAGQDCIGVSSVARREPGEFSDEQISLLRAFVDQAVIAIQNARLFNETQEALAHQTASADILRVISSSPTDVQPVFEAIVGTAVKHLGCDLALVQTVSGDTYSPKAMATRPASTPVPGAQVMPVDPAANFPSRAIRSKTMLHVSDWSAVELPPHEQVRHQQLGLNSALYLPLLRGDECVGVLVLGSTKANAFNPKAIALAESFRDQALIAIENTRLFNETQEALEQQTATLGSAAGDRQFDVGRATGVREDPRKLRPAVQRHEPGAQPPGRRRRLAPGGAAHRRQWPARLDANQIRAIRELGNTAYPIKLHGKELAWMRQAKGIYSVSDVLNDPRLGPAMRAPAVALGFSYAQMGATMFTGNKCIGSIVVTREAAGGFPTRSRRS